MITLAVSTGATIVLWNFGLGARLWPAHPFLASVVVAAGGGIAAQLLLTRK
jgi:hypothetical protein